MDVTFSQFEPTVQDSTNGLGYLTLTDFIGERWTNTGSSPSTDASVSCGYDSVSTSTSVILNQNQLVHCLLPLENQPPFLMWTSPSDSSVFSSQGSVEFNASDSWDLDDDELTFSWTSSLDGDILASCTGQGQGFENQYNVTRGYPFTVNGNHAGNCTLSDGIHSITLEICDDAGHCVTENRTIELVNQAPTILLEVTPAMTPWSELVIPRTEHVRLDISGTFDPENDPLKCWIDRSYLASTDESTVVGCPPEIWMNLTMAETVPSIFTLTVYASDGVNTPSSYTIPVELYNEVPVPEFTLTRAGNASEDLVTLDGTATVDPEGDVLEVEFWSNLDGQLSWNDTEEGKVWSGYLSRGVHNIEMRVVDVRPEHINSTRTTTLQVTVENSLPRSVISEPLETQTYLSSELIWFSANLSGDYDSACSTFPLDGNWHCSAFEPSSGSEYLVVDWQSDLDGRLTPEGEDWLIFEGRLSAGTHTVTLSVDDGIHDPVIASQTIEVLTSAPVLDMTSPVDGDVFSSNHVIDWDARQSVDYDEDNFTMTVRSNLLNEPLFSDVSTAIVHQSALPAGEHSIQVSLMDSTGKEQLTSFSVVIIQSDPVAVLVQPQNLISVLPGQALVLEEQSTDADGDMQKREWRNWLVTGNYQILSTLSSDSITLPPGQYHLSLYVEDSRGASSEVHVNITVQSSLPTLSNLTFMPDVLVAQQKNTFSVRVLMDDPDGTTESVQGTIVFNVQTWSFNLTDENGDGYWEGAVEMNPASAGRPNLKVIATDGTGDDAMVDILSITLSVEEAEQDSRAAFFIAGTIGFVGLLSFIAFVALRRQKKAELAMIDSWDSFGGFSAKPDSGKTLVSLEGGAMEGATEVLEDSETSSSMDEESPEITPSESKPVTGMDLDWDNV